MAGQEGGGGVRDGGVRGDGGGSPGAVHGLLHAVRGVHDVLVDVVLDRDQAAVDLGGFFDVSLECFLQLLRVLVVVVLVGVFGFEGPVFPDGEAEAEFFILGEAELLDAFDVSALGDEGYICHVVVWVVLVGCEIAV